MKKNKKEKIAILGITVITLLIAVIGTTYAFFSSSVRTNTDNGNENIESNLTVLASATMELGSNITAGNIVPGYKVVKTVQVLGSGSENARDIKAYITLTPNVIDFSNHVKYTLYAVENSNIDASTICTESNKVNENNQVYDEMTCNTTNLGTPVASGTFDTI